MAQVLKIMDLDTVIVFEFHFISSFKRPYLEIESLCFIAVSLELDLETEIKGIISL